MLPLLYKSLVRHRMELSLQTWSPYTRRDIGRLEKIQGRATKLLLTLAHLPHGAMLSKLNLTILEKRSKGDMIEAFKILEWFDQVCRDEIYLILAPRHCHLWTRGFNLKLEKLRHHTHKSSE